MPSQDGCRLFHLPAELRNEIYQLCFTTDEQEVDCADLPQLFRDSKQTVRAAEAEAKRCARHNTPFTGARNNSSKSAEDTAVIELASIKPPSRALLLTCQIVRSEGREIYQEAYKQYWTNNTFGLGAPSEADDEIRQFISQLGDRDLAHMQNFTMHLNEPRSSMAKKNVEVLMRKSGSQWLFGMDIEATYERYLKENTAGDDIPLVEYNIELLSLFFDQIAVHVHRSLPGPSGDRSVGAGIGRPRLLEVLHRFKALGGMCV